MPSLPAVKGQYKVGATSFKLPVKQPIHVGTSQIRTKAGDLAPALELHEVSFTIYHPVASNTPRKSIHWLLRPLNDSIQGLSRFSGAPEWVIRTVVHIFGRFLTIPNTPNAPLLHSNGSPWPLVIFSHGLGGSSRAYSHICNHLAASGRVVIALGHGDGTSPTTDGKATPKFYFRDKDVIWSEGKSNESGPMPIRTDQLTYRRHEIYNAYHAFRSLVQTGSSSLEAVEGANIDWNSWTKDAPVNCSSLALAGHSFGGATLLSILSNSPPSEDLSPLPITHALLLDPWVEPFTSPGPAPYSGLSQGLSRVNQGPAPSISTDSTPRHSEDGTAVASTVAHNGEIGTPRLLVLNSEGFSMWKSHFTRLGDITKGWEPNGRRIVTLVGSKHAAFSDFPILPAIPGRKTGLKYLEVTAILSLAFLDNQIEDGLRGVNSRKLEFEEVKGKKGSDGEPKMRMVGEPGDVVIH